MKEVNFPCGNVYAMIDEKLQCVTIKSIVTDAGCNVLKTTLCMPGGETRTFDGALSYYASEETFKNGSVVSRPFIPCYNMSDYSNGDYLLRGWSMIDGEPALVTKEIETFEFDNPYSAHPVITLKGGESYDNMYPSREACIEHNEYDVVLEDGTIEHRVGLAKLLELTPEQNALVDELMAKLEELKNAGVKMNLTNYEETVSFINTNNVKGCYWSYEQDEDGDVYVDESYIRFENIPICGRSEEDSFYIKR